MTKTGKSATVVGLTIRMERVTVYNLRAKNLQLYAVGEHGVLMHNNSALPRPTLTREQVRRSGGSEWIRKEIQ